MNQDVVSDGRYIMTQLSVIVQVCDGLCADDPTLTRFRRVVTDAASRILDALHRIVSKA